MLRLMLLRHGEATRPVDLVDHERPLSIPGHKQARQMGEYIAQQKLTPEITIVSTARRAQETWAEARDAGSIITTENNEPRIYESSIDNLLTVIGHHDPKFRSMMLVGHNPGLEQLTTWLTGSGDKTALAHLQQGFVVGSLAVIDIPANDWAALQAQSGHLRRFETPDTV